MKRIHTILLINKYDDAALYHVHTDAEDFDNDDAIAHLKEIDAWHDAWDTRDDIHVDVYARDNEPLEELAEQLRQPDTDDADTILRGVYETLGLPVPSFLEPR